MKTLYKNLIIVLTLILAVSCHPSQMLTVVGEPGTKIFDTAGNEKATINSSGQAQVEVMAESPHQFLFSKDLSGRVVPFALDYNYRKKAYGPKVALCTFVGILTIGSLLIYPCIFYSLPLQNDYCFTYRGQQTTNEKLHFCELIDDAPYKELSSAPVKSIAEKPEVIQIAEPKPEAKKSAPKTALSSRLFQDNAKNVEGEFAGIASLSINGREMQSFNNVSVVITKISNTTVKVAVKEYNVDFFEEDQIYIVSKASDGSYSLQLENVPEATIKIAHNKLIYKHPAISDESGTTFCLEIKAEKK